MIIFEQASECPEPGPLLLQYIFRNANAIDHPKKIAGHSTHSNEVARRDLMADWHVGFVEMSRALRESIRAINNHWDQPLVLAIGINHWY